MAACNVELIAFKRTCRSVPARPFEAVCGCGHLISGDICAPCSLATAPGCLTCWRDGYRCRTEFKAGGA